jgi:predicted XRE-type DNA-binding protein
MERDTMSAWLQECDSCHYVGVDLERESEAAREIVASEAYQSLISNSEVPAIARRFALCSLLMSDIGREISATALLRAAWVCDDEEAVEEVSEAEAARLFNVHRSTISRVMREGAPDAAG